MIDDEKSGDILGIKPIAEATKIVTQGLVDGTAAFLGRICLPAAEEFGLLLKDRVSYWRACNLIVISQKTEKYLKEQERAIGVHAHPRIINEILEKGSWCETEDLQSMWAGLLASSCTQDGKDESSLLFVNLLSHITSAQARFLNYICIHAKKSMSNDNLIYVDERITLTIDELTEIWQDQDRHRIDRELDHLRSIELIDGGLPLDKIKNDKPQNPLFAIVAPTSIALHLFVRCNGSQLSPEKFFNIQE